MGLHSCCPSCSNTRSSSPPQKKAGRKWLEVSCSALVLFNIFIEPCAE